MSPDFCDDHSELVKIVGEINGKQNMLIDMNKKLQDDISKLFTLFNKSDKNIAVQNTKTAPIFWVIVTVGAALILVLIKQVFH